jgi:8-oxo-dGTP pyrophosphatase MutT (NUDIX family)
MSRREELLADLALYEAADAGDAAQLARVRALLEAAPDPFTRWVPEHVTASAVVARPAGESFLFVHHRRLERWLQPGGHVEPEDGSAFEAALREAREETGVLSLEAPFGPRILDLDVHPVPPKGGKPAHVHYDLRYLATTLEEGAAGATAEVRAVRWFPYEEALASAADESLARALRKARAWLSGEVVRS